MELNHTAFHADSRSVPWVSAEVSSSLRLDHNAEVIHLLWLIREALHSIPFTKEKDKLNSIFHLSRVY